MSDGYYTLGINNNTLKVGNIPELSTAPSSSTTCKLDWTKLHQDDLETYYKQTDCLIQELTMPESLLCDDINCMDGNHVTELNDLYGAVVETLKQASLPLYKVRKSHPNSRPGWNEYAADLHKVARDAFRIWCNHGKEVKCLDTSNAPLPTNIEGVVGCDNSE